MGIFLRSWGTLLGLLLLASALPSPSQAGEGCEEWSARLVSVQGRVEQRGQGKTSWSPSSPDARLCPGDTLRTGANSRAAVQLPNETLVRLDQLTTVIFPEAGAQEQGLLLDILRGIGYFFSRTPKKIKIKAPFVNAAIEGTEFLVSATQGQSRVLVLDGHVRANNAMGALTLAGGEAAVAGPGEAPRRILVADPEDAVKWALYYPPVIGFGAEDPAIPASIRDAIDAFHRGDIAGTLSELDSVPGSARSARFYTFRASILLYVGRVEDAQADVTRASKLDSNDGGALAVRSIIALMLGDSDAAMQLAMKGEQSQGPGGAASQIALSYVYQSRFDLDQAFIHARSATELAPENPLGWARLSEIDLARRNFDSALRAAQTATSLNPRISRAQTTLGFAQLLRFESDEAADSFSRAIALDQADPLPRLGLGISKIHRGQVAEGQRDIEIAVAIDPATSIFRSYLGKAFYDEKRDGRAATEYRIAKELDDKDPTPWFYDAIRKQTANRPVGALDDIRHSIMLNDNRAVYRSRLALDSDLAARSASQARIYTDLGFEDLALAEGWSSVNEQPGNFSAHRFLAEAYLGKPRFEVARAAEFIQSQLWQPLNLNPIQPQLARSNLGIIQSAGPTLAGLNEYNPLFLSDGVQVQANLIGGGDNTFGDDLALSAVTGRFSLGAGQFRFETDGFRPNADQNQDLYSLFAQFSPSQRASMQVEYRRSEADIGDTVLRFDPEDFSPWLRYERTADTLRWGGRYEFSPRTKMIASVIGEEFDLKKSDRILGRIPLNQDTESRSLATEIQQVYEGDRFNLIGGLGYLRVKSKSTVEINRSPQNIDQDFENYKAYLYTNYAVNRSLELHAGVSYNECTSPARDRSELDPKLGISWEVTPATEVRAAAFETVRCVGADPREPALSLPQPENETIEPTQIAGFNQLFDDLSGTTSDVFGVALDHRFTSRLFAGGSFTRRDIRVPHFNKFGAPEEEKWRDEFARAYLDFAPDDNWALSLAYQYEMQDYTEDLAINGATRLETHRIPLSLRFFSKQGLSAGVTASYLDQEIRLYDTFTGASGSDQDSFWLVDAALVYRLPNRWGFFSLEVKNLFDEEFRFQEPDPNVPTLYPDRLFLARLSLNFN